jgi:hypothetical protein
MVWVGRERVKYRVQRRILDELDKFHEQYGPLWVTLRSLVRVIGKDDERSSQESVRRAVRMLARRELVKMRFASGRGSIVVVQKAGMPDPKQPTVEEEAAFEELLLGLLHRYESTAAGGRVDAPPSDDVRETV